MTDFATLLVTFSLGMLVGSVYATWVLRGRRPVTHWVTLDDWDSDGIPKKIHCACDKGVDHHALDGPMPAPLKPCTPLTDDDKRKVDEWITKFTETFRATTELPQHLRKPFNWQAEIKRWQEIIDKAPPARTEPFKLTPSQWAGIRSRYSPEPGYRWSGGSLGELTGIPVVMVDSEKDSTPVVEGWIKRKPWWRRVLRKLRWSR